MPYNPNMYNLGGQQYFPQPSAGFAMGQQPVNGLVAIDGIEGARMYQLPPNSVSPPLFLRNENAFFVKSTDGGGAPSLRRFTFSEDVIEPNNAGMFVTRDYFDKQMKMIMEAINERAVPERPATDKPAQPADEAPADGAVK